MIETCLKYKEMSCLWDLIHDLLGGTIAMRQTGERWLPREPKELHEKYRIRLERSILFNGFKDTIRRLVAKPFSRPVTVNNPPDRLEYFDDNVDRTGTDLTQFSREVFTSGLTYGLSHILVDFPQAAERTYADEQKLYPVWIHIKPPQLLSWKTEVVNSIRILTEIKFEEMRTEGEPEKYVKYIRVFTRGTWELWKEDKDTPIKIEEGLHSFGRIPLVTFYMNKTGYMTGSPPLEDLAWLNLAHWQSNSDQRNILRFARAGILFTTGFSEQETGKINIGPNAVVSASAPDAKMEFVEHTGRAIKAGAEDVTKLEERMELLGMQPLISRTAKSTATGKIIDEARSHTDVQAWIRSLENSLVETYGLSAEWVKMDLPEDFGIDVFSDFSVGMTGDSDVPDLITLRKDGQITQTLLLQEMKRRGVLSESVDVEAEIAAVEAENPLI